MHAVDDELLIDRASGRRPTCIEIGNNCTGVACCVLCVCETQEMFGLRC